MDTSKWASRDNFSGAALILEALPCGFLGIAAPLPLALCTTTSDRQPLPAFRCVEVSSLLTTIAPRKNGASKVLKILSAIQGMTTPFQYTYGTGDVSGTLFSDTLQVAGITLTSQVMGQATEVSLDFAVATCDGLFVRNLLSPCQLQRAPLQAPANHHLLKVDHCPLWNVSPLADRHRASVLLAGLGLPKYREQQRRQYHFAFPAYASGLNTGPAALFTVAQSRCERRICWRAAVRRNQPCAVQWRHQVHAPCTQPQLVSPVVSRSTSSPHAVGI